MLTGKYVGEIDSLQGRTALLQQYSNGYLAQFNFKVPGKVDTHDKWCFGWHFFKAKDFKLCTQPSS